MISIAIPDSLFAEDDSLRGKTEKVGQIARAVAIFGVDRIYIYRDLSKNFESDYEVAKLIFEYAETPQYLRRKLISRKKELEFVGILPPLRIPSHQRDVNVSQGEIREAVVLMQNGELMADMGARELAKVEGRVHEGQRVTVKVKETRPLIVETAERPKGEYWGYEVRRAPSLTRFLKSANFDVTILTSRLGTQIQQVWNEFCSRISTAEKILICFGSPEAGVDKMLSQDRGKIGDFDSLYLNIFPFQNTETVRLEEAIIGTLSILNIARRL